VPEIIGSFDTDGAAWGVKVKGGYAYVLDWWGGIKVVDVRRPAHPAYVGRYQARGTLQQLRTKGTYLYAASGAGGLQVYDIKNPLNPIWAKGLDMDGEAQDLWIEDTLAYVASGDGGVAIFDILDPFYTRQVGGIDTPGEATQVVAGNDYLYIADSQAGLLVMDVRDPQRPVEVARYDVQVQNLWLDERALWLVSPAGLLAWRVSGDGHLHQELTVPGEFTAVRARDDLLIAATRSGEIKLWRRTAQGLEVLGDYASGDAVSGLQLDGELLYVQGIRNGLHVLDISQPRTPRLKTAYPATGHHTALAIARGAAFFAGEAKLASVTLLPTVPVVVKNQQELSLQIPADLPRGDYHLLAVGVNGQRQLLPQALKVQFAAPGRKNATLSDFRRLLKTPLKPPPTVETELPSAP
jgi:hypothetical protein